jgi:pantoate--beta-alanine ligase
VTTVVSKLFNIVQPDEAIFGIKDYQQLAVIKRMTEDLCLSVQITSAPIHREADGLAMSSRNSYISKQERPKVKVLKEVLELIAQQIKAGNLNFSKLEIEAKKRIEFEGFKVDYVTVSNSKTLQPAAVDDRQITILGAIYTASARLIDNISINLQ